MFNTNINYLKLKIIQLQVFKTFLNYSFEKFNINYTSKKRIRVSS